MLILNTKTGTIEEVENINEVKKEWTLEDEFTWFDTNLEEYPYFIDYFVMHDRISKDNTPVDEKIYEAEYVITLDDGEHLVVFSQTGYYNLDNWWKDHSDVNYMNACALLREITDAGVEGEEFIRYIQFSQYFDKLVKKGNELQIGKNAFKPIPVSQEVLDSCAAGWADCTVDNKGE